MARPRLRPAAWGHAPVAEMPCLARRNALLLAIAMEKLPLPMNTVLDGPERDPMLDDEAVAVLKAVYLKQPQVPEFRARGMSDTEIVDAMHGIAQAGILKIVKAAAESASCRLLPVQPPLA